MSRRLLSLCLGVPEWGDANPWAYALHEILGQAGFEALLVNLLTDSDVFYFRHLLGHDCEEWDPLESTCRHASLSIL